MLIVIDENDISRLKEIFVTKEQCQETNDMHEENFISVQVDLATIKTQLKSITWLSTAVIGGVITMLIKIFFGD